MALLSTPLLRLHGWVALCVLWLAGSLCAAATPTRWQPPANSLLSIIFTNVPKQLPDLLAVVGEADLVEEVARIASLTRLVGKPLPRAQAGVPAPVLTPLQSREKAARRTLAAALA